MVRYNLESSVSEKPNLVCTFTGRMDTENCKQVEEELFNKVRESKVPVIFDLQDVDYISSLFLRMCIKVSREVGTENFSIINVRPKVKEVFKIARFDDLLSIS